jgi:hypothetical protein
MNGKNLQIPQLSMLFFLRIVTAKKIKNVKFHFKT